MRRIIERWYSVKNFSYLADIDDVQLNQQKNEWEGWSMKVIASKIWNDSNHKKLHSIK